MLLILHSRRRTQDESIRSISIYFMIIANHGIPLPTEVGGTENWPITGFAHRAQEK